MVGNITECGKMENNMERACFLVKMKTPIKREFGMMERESDGLVNRNYLNSM